jgi:hypothetical protein
MRLSRKKLITEKGEKKGKKKESPGEKEIGRPHLCSAILPLCSFQPVVSDPLKAAGTLRSIFVLPWDIFYTYVGFGLPHGAPDTA